MKIRSKITITLLSISCAVIVAADFFSVVTLENYFRSRILGELKRQGSEIELIVRSPFVSDSAGYRRLQHFAHMAEIRVTLIDREGTVAFESEIAQAQLGQIENHLHRPEVEDAFRTGYGTSIRKSATLDVDMLYLARKIVPATEQTGFLHDVAVIRLGIPLTLVNMLMDELRSKVILASIAVLLFVLVATIFLSRKLASPIVEIDRIAAMIRAGDLHQRLPIHSRDELGSLSGTLNAMLDNLNVDIAQLKKLERVRSEFLGNVSHELRTPIFAIQGMLETLLQGAIEDPDVSREFVQRALQNTKRLNALLGDLIEISRIESGDMKMSFRYFDVGEFLDEVVKEMLPVAASRSIALSSAGAPADTLIYGDKERLRQVMNNLIDNAVKYTPENGRVTVAAALSADRVTISVQDTGTGIAPEHIARIFERFYRVDRERSREAGGTGLGLAIVKHIIEAHGSSVEVRSEPGKGSTFTFTLRASHETKKHQEDQSS